MTVLKYRGSNGAIKTLLDVTGTLSRIGALETKTNNLQTTVNALNASSGWKRLSKNCWYKKVGLWCTVQCDYISPPPSYHCRVNGRRAAMAKLKYRKGSEIFEIFDTDDIKALQTKVDEVPRLPTFGSTSGNWPFGVVY